MLKKLISTWFVLFSIFTPLFSQKDFPKNYFRSPVDIPIVLAGNFGEIRGGHFHAGIDIKTQQVEGKKVFAAADGYVSRIKISLYGYGKVIYVRHPNGYTTAYAHLQQFNDSINQIVKKEQYKRKRFELDIYPAEGFIKVKKGEIIALSGNTGGSGGPHLHFEIRETATETPINPLLFGFNIKDTRKPKLKKLGIYPLNEVSMVNGSNKASYFNLSNKTGKYQVITDSVITLNGKIGFGLEAEDYLDDASNRCGAYEMKLFKNDKIVFAHTKTKIDFAETRYINSHVDYYAWNKLKSRVERFYLEPNNPLKFYHDAHNAGQLFFLNDTTYDMKFEIRDAYQNLSSLNFQVKSISKGSEFKKAPSDTMLFVFDRENYFETKHAKLSLPARVLYDNIYFNYKVEEPIENSISDVHHFQDLYTPLQSYATFYLELDSIYHPIKSKVVLVSLNAKNKVLSSEGGTFKDGFISTRSRSFGPYCLMVDTIGPKIKSVNIYSGKNMNTENKISIKISDDLSGIKSYNGYINDNWELFELDKKTGIMWFNFTSNYNNSLEHKLRISITDERGNNSEFTTTFVR